MAKYTIYIYNTETPCPLAAVLHECNAIFENQRLLFIEEQLAELRPKMVALAQAEERRLKMEAQDDPMKLLIIPSLKRLSGMFFIYHCLNLRKNYIEM